MFFSAAVYKHCAGEMWFSYIERFEDKTAQTNSLVLKACARVGDLQSAVDAFSASYASLQQTLKAVDGNTGMNAQTRVQGYRDALASSDSGITVVNDKLNALIGLHSDISTGMLNLLNGLQDCKEFKPFAARVNAMLSQLEATLSQAYKLGTGQSGQDGLEGISNRLVNLLGTRQQALTVAKVPCIRNNYGALQPSVQSLVNAMGQLRADLTKLCADMAGVACAKPVNPIDAVVCTGSCTAGMCSPFGTTSGTTSGTSSGTSSGTISGTSIGPTSGTCSWGTLVGLLVGSTCVFGNVAQGSCVGTLLCSTPAGQPTCVTSLLCPYAPITSVGGFKGNPGAATTTNSGAATAASTACPMTKMTYDAKRGEYDIQTHPDIGDWGVQNELCGKNAYISDWRAQQAGIAASRCYKIDQFGSATASGNWLWKQQADANVAQAKAAATQQLADAQAKAAQQVAAAQAQLRTAKQADIALQNKYAACQSAFGAQCSAAARKETFVDYKTISDALLAGSQATQNAATGNGDSSKAVSDAVMTALQKPEVVQAFTKAGAKAMRAALPPGSELSLDTLQQVALSTVQQTIVHDALQVAAWGTLQQVAASKAQASGGNPVLKGALDNATAQQLQNVMKQPDVQAMIQRQVAQAVQAALGAQAGNPGVQAAVQTAAQTAVQLPQVASSLQQTAQQALQTCNATATCNSGNAYDIRNHKQYPQFIKDYTANSDIPSKCQGMYANFDLTKHPGYPAAITKAQQDAAAKCKKVGDYRLYELGANPEFKAYAQDWSARYQALQQQQRDAQNKLAAATTACQGSHDAFKLQITALAQQLQAAQQEFDRQLAAAQQAAQQQSQAAAAQQQADAAQQSQQTTATQQQLRTAQDQHAQTKTQLADAQEKLAATLAALQATEKAANGQLSALHAQLCDAKTQGTKTLKAAQDHVASLTKELAALQASEEAAKGQVSSREAELAKAQERLRDTLAALEATEKAANGQLSGLHTQLSDARTRAANDLKAAQAQVASLTKELAAAKQALQRQSSSQHGSQSTANQHHQALLVQLASFRQQFSALQATVQELTRAQQRCKAQLAATAAASKTAAAGVARHVSIAPGNVRAQCAARKASAAAGNCAKRFQPFTGKALEAFTAPLETFAAVPPMPQCKRNYTAHKYPQQHQPTDPFDVMLHRDYRYSDKRGGHMPKQECYDTYAAYSADGRPIPCYRAVEATKQHCQQAPITQHPDYAKTLLSYGAVRDASGHLVAPPKCPCNLSAKHGQVAFKPCAKHRAAGPGQRQQFEAMLREEKMKFNVLLDRYKALAASLHGPDDQRIVRDLRQAHSAIKAKESLCSSLPDSGAKDPGTLNLHLAAQAAALRPVAQLPMIGSGLPGGL